MRVMKIVILLLIVGFLGFVLYNAVKSQNTNILTIHAEYRDIEKKLIVSGTVEPLKEIEVKSTISGVLEELFVQIGSEVVSGQNIAKVQFVLDPLEYELLLKDKEIAKIRFKNIKSEFERTKSLYNKGIIAKEEFEKGEANFIVAKSEQDAIITKLEMLKGNYKKRDVSNIITATGNGSILELPIKEGGSVMARGSWSEGTTVAKIADLNSLIFKGDVLESDILKLHSGMEMSFSLVTKKDVIFKGTLCLINPKAFVKNGIARFEITANIDVPEEYRSFIKAGSSANGEVVLERKEHVLSLEEKYFQFDYDSIFVEIENEKGLFDKRFIQTGISDGIYTEIISGIDSLSKIKDEK
jgi:HlyD family secretion protein